MFILFNRNTYQWATYKLWKQESPPVWTQEAYRPLCSKYSLCCSVSGKGDVLPPAWLGTGGNTPSSPTGGGTPIQPDWGGSHHQAGWGIPSPLNWMGGTPQVWTDRHLWKQYLPHSETHSGGNYTTKPINPCLLYPPKYPTLYVDFF